MPNDSKTPQEIVIDLDQPMDARELRDPGEWFQSKAYLELKEVLQRIHANLPDPDHEEPSEFGILNRPHQTIFVEGIRGAGKTTFLLNIEKHLKLVAPSGNDHDKSLARAFKFLHPLDPTRVEPQKPVQSSFLSTIIALLVNAYQDSLNHNYRPSRHDSHTEELQNKLYDLVDKISNALHGSFPPDSMVGFEKISAQQNNLMLEKYLQDLFRSLCQHFKCKAIILMIDDTDMAMQYSFDILEVVRRFLSSPHLITIISGQKSLYELVIRHHFHQQVSLEKLAYSDRPGAVRHDDVNIIDDVATSYFEKIFPRNHRVDLESIVHIIRTQPVMVKTAQGTIPLRLLQELSKKVLYPGVAMRHTEALFAPEQEHITAREVLQRLGSLYKHVQIAIRTYKEILSRTSASPDCPIDKDKLEKNLDSISTKLKPHDLHFENVPYLIHVLAKRFLDQVDREELLRSCDRHNIYQHIDSESNNPDCNTYLRRDLAAVRNGRISAVAIFENSWQRFSANKEGNNNLDIQQFVDINSKLEISINIILLNIIAKDNHDFFFIISLFFHQRRVLNGVRNNFLLISQPFLKLIFIGLEKDVDRSDILNCIDREIFANQNNHVWCVNCKTSNCDQCFTKKINEWRKDYNTGKRHICSRQIDLILDKFLDNILQIFDNINPNSPARLGILLYTLSCAFLNAVACSEKERFDDGPLSTKQIELPDNIEQIINSEPFRTNISPLKEKKFPSLTLIFSNHPIIKAIFESQNQLNTATIQVNNQTDQLTDCVNTFKSTIAFLSKGGNYLDASTPEIDLQIEELNRRTLSAPEKNRLTELFLEIKESHLRLLNDNQLLLLEQAIGANKGTFTR